MKNNAVKIVNIIFVLGVFGFMLFGLGKAYLHPIEENEYENRTAQRMPLPRVETFIDGSFQSEIESALADQSPAAVPMKKLYNGAVNSVKLSVVDALRRAGGEGQFIGFNSLVYNDGYLLEPMVPLEEVESELSESLDTLQGAVDGLSVPVYLYYVGRDMDTDFQSGAHSGVYEYIREGMQNVPEIAGIERFHVEGIEEYKANFYKTDHHYNHLGAHRAYTQVLGLLAEDAKPLDCGEEIKIDYGFNGSRSRTAGALGLVSEQIYAYDYDLPDVEITINGEPRSAYGNRERYLSGIQSKETTADYAHFYGYDSGCIVFDNPEAQNGERLLILGDSYDNAYIWLLSAHFESVHAVDLRNYASEKDGAGEPFRLSEYVRENGITKVLFAGRNEFYYDTLKGLEG